MKFGSAARLVPCLLLCRLLLAQAPSVTGTKWVENWDETGKGREQLRKINGRWWSQDNREVFPPAKDGFFWTLDSKPGTCQFFHHRPIDLTRAESLHLWMTPQEVQAVLGQPNRTFGTDQHGFWYYYASNGTKLTVRFMGDGVLGEAKYVDIGEKSRPVASIEAELNGRNIYQLLAERARQKSYRQSPRAVSNYPSSGARRRGQPNVVALVATSADPTPPVAKRILPAEAYQAVRIGASREDVLRQLGEPNSRYAIADDQGTHESFTYELDTGETVVIRLIGGKVVNLR